MIGQKYIFMGIAVFALLGGTFTYGYHRGSVNQIKQFEDDRQELQTDLLDLADQIREKNSIILREQREKEDLIDELEEQANNAVGSSNPGVANTGGLQRLEKRWGPTPGSP